MADAFDDTEKLFARASAAIAEATRLAEESLDWRKSLSERIRCMRTRAKFHPKSLRIYSPLDFMYRLQPCQRTSGETDDGSGVAMFIFDRRADSSD
jgi:hypothetical protein